MKNAEWNGREYFAVTLQEGRQRTFVEVKTESRQDKSDVAKRLANNYGIHKIRINTPLPDLKVNIYFMEKPVPTLIDVPPDVPSSLDELNTALLARGY